MANSGKSTSTRNRKAARDLQARSGSDNDNAGARNAEPAEETEAEKEALEPAENEAEEQEQQSEGIVINKWCLPDLKNTCDDRLRELLSTRHEFAQSHRHTDAKLVMGYASCLVGAALVLYSYKTPFDKTTLVSVIGIVSYFALSTGMAAYVMFLERSVIYEGSRVDDATSLQEHIEVSATVGRYNPVYECVFRVSQLHASQKATSKSTTAGSSSPSKSFLPSGSGETKTQVPFASLFDENGLFVHELFDQKVDEWVATARRNRQEQQQKKGSRGISSTNLPSPKPSRKKRS